ncbi:hypothetical protein AXG93_2035s1100 [Marchantia polymorpha subsp. ruderalis]|uniref:F-box domain-containing protein n=1 Tax=Marchantia polymorpha subsp. ruderalis TaxID=1480154 RepID=A0A176VP89_MARPO|nr:hypothetical protein AXG93_2035s1100 [Marchantia polymorpha subsp. ruderalis]
MAGNRTIFSQFPEEILGKVFSQLSMEDLVHATAVCKAWQQVASSETLWELICRRRWRLWMRPSADASAGTSQLKGCYWRSMCQQRVELDTLARSLVADMAWPLKRHCCLRQLVSLGDYVVEELEKLSSQQGTLLEGIRYFASVALERINQSNCVKAMQELLKTPLPKLEDCLARGALIIAKLRYQDLDIEAIESKLDDWKEILLERLRNDPEFTRQGGLETSGGTLAGLKQLNVLIFGKVRCPTQGEETVLHGHHVDDVLQDSQERQNLNLRASREDYYNPSYYYLNEVLDSRKGVETRLEKKKVQMSVSSMYRIPVAFFNVANALTSFSRYQGDGDQDARRQPKERQRMLLPLLDLLLAIKPDDCSNRFNRVKVLLEMSDFEAAIKDLEELLRLTDKAGMNAEDGISRALLQQYLQNAKEKREFHAAWSSARRTPRPHDVLYKIGTIVTHVRLQYPGVIFGWDREFSLDEEWITVMKVDQLQYGRSQPFYRVLVDQNFRSTSTYVAQENIMLAPGSGPLVHEELGMHFIGYRDGMYIPNEHLCYLYPEDVVEQEDESQLRDQTEIDKTWAYDLNKHAPTSTSHSEVEAGPSEFLPSLSQESERAAPKPPEQPKG